MIEMAALKMFAPPQLKVFTQIPDDQSNTHIEDSFEPEAQTPQVPATSAAWEQLKESWMNGLREKCFAGWPADSGTPRVCKTFTKERDSILYETYEIKSEHDVSLPIHLIRKAGVKPRQLVLLIADASFTDDDSDSGSQESFGDIGWAGTTDNLEKEIKNQDTAFALFLPRDIGPAWRSSTMNDTQLRRRFMLIGQTLDGMRVWDICRAVEALPSLEGMGDAPLRIEAGGEMGVNALYASLFVPGISALHLQHIPASQMKGPDYLNVLKILDIPQVAAMAAERCPLELQSDETNGWGFLNSMAAAPVANLKVEWIK